MKNDALQQLKVEAEAAKRDRYPNVPAHALPRAKYSERSANDLTKCIIDFVNLQPGCVAWRVSNVPVYDTKTGKHRAGNVRKGVADISAIRRGQAWQIEVKFGKDIMSEHQRKFAAAVEASGGVYCVAHTFEQFINQWNNPRKSAALQVDPNLLL